MIIFTTWMRVNAINSAILTTAHKPSRRAKPLSITSLPSVRAEAPLRNFISNTRRLAAIHGSAPMIPIVSSRRGAMQNNDAPSSSFKGSVNRRALLLRLQPSRPFSRCCSDRNASPKVPWGPHSTGAGALASQTAVSQSALVCRRMFLRMSRLRSLSLGGALALICCAPCVNAQYSGRERKEQSTATQSIQTCETPTNRSGGNPGRTTSTTKSQSPFSNGRNAKWNSRDDILLYR